MLRHPVRLLFALTAVAAVGAALSPTAPAVAAPNAFDVVAPVAFSPDGDGVKDRVPVRIKLPHAGKVVVEVSRNYGGAKVVRTVRLGTQPAGVTTWTWDGRSDADKWLPDGPYVVEVYVDWTDPGVGEGAPRRDVVAIDTDFEPSLTAPTYGVGRDSATYRVFPRSTVVRDALPLDARVDEDAVRSLRLVIRDRGGRVVHSSDANRVVEQSSLGYVPDGHGGLRELKARGRTVAWTARRGGAVLPRGRYTAVVEGRDRAGNSGRSERLRLFVSDDKLVWKERTTDVAPADSRASSCALFELDRCGDLPPCAEVVESTRFPGGLSHRSGVPVRFCSGDDRAASLHLLEVPAATGVRGVDSARVSFVGAATNAGEPDTGTLTLLSNGPDRAADSSVTGATGTTGWVTAPYLGEGIPPEDGIRTAPSVGWAFETAGGDWFDVATYTVDYHYLAIAR